MKQLVNDTLQEINLYSDDASNLILGTISQESAYGFYRKQLGGGPALGICQMEPNTFNDIVFNFLHYKVDLANLILMVCGLTSFHADDLVTNDKLAVSMCRVHYLRVKAKIPSDLPGYAAYYKKYYNTPLGAATEEEFIENYNKYVLKDEH